MIPRRRPPITTLQALLGTLALILAVAAVVAGTASLQLPAERLAPLDAPELGDDAGRRPGEVRCPSRQEVARRGTPPSVTSAELIECPTLFDGETVAYEGEAVGAVLLRTDHAWLHLNDDRYALEIGPLSRHRAAVGGNSGMAVSVPREAGVGVVVGGYHRRGTGVAVVGTYRRASDLDGGAPAIEADEVRVTRAPEVTTESVSLRRVVAAVLALTLTGGLAAQLVRSRRRAHAV